MIWLNFYNVYLSSDIGVYFSSGLLLFFFFSHKKDTNSVSKTQDWSFGYLNFHCLGLVLYCFCESNPYCWSIGFSGISFKTLVLQECSYSIFLGLFGKVERSSGVTGTAFLYARCMNSCPHVSIAPFCLHLLYLLLLLLLSRFSRVRFCATP